MAKNKIDWEEAKRIFVTGAERNMGKIAAMFNVDERSVYRHRRQENWDEERKAYVKECTSRVIENSMADECDKLLKLKEVTNKAIELANLYFTDDMLSPRDFKAIVDSVKSLIEMQRDLNGLLNLKDQKAIEIAEAKANLTEDESGETGIAFLPNVVEDVVDNVVIEEQQDV